MLILRSVKTGLKTLRSNLSPGQSARHFFGGSRKGQINDEVLTQFRHFNRQLLLAFTLSYLGVFIAYAAVPGWRPFIGERTKLDTYFDKILGIDRDGHSEEGEDSSKVN